MVIFFGSDRRDVFCWNERNLSPIIEDRFWSFGADGGGQAECFDPFCRNLELIHHLPFLANQSD